MPPRKWLRRESTHRTSPPQRRYWPRKKQRSVHHAGRKKRCPGLAGKTTSRGRKTSTRNRKLRPAVKTIPCTFIGRRLQLLRVLGRLGLARTRRALRLRIGENNGL